MARPLKFVIALTAGLAFVTLVALQAVQRTTQAWFENDLRLRSELAARGAHHGLVLCWDDPERLNQILAEITRDERIMAAAAFSSDGSSLAVTPGFSPEFSPDFPPSARRDVAGVLGRGHPEPARTDTTASHAIVPLAGGRVHASVIPVVENGRVLGSVVLLHDLTFIERRDARTRQFLLFAFVFLALAASGVTALAYWWSRRDWHEGLRHLLHGETDRPEFRPLLRDVRELVDRMLAERDSHQEGEHWTAERLKSTLTRYLHGEKVVILANREPYIHVRDDDGAIVVHRPASGLVTALEPVMLACSGVWIAHGSGSADREVVDDKDRVRVPPGAGSYALRRVWLTREEEGGYYYGFANEGIWPLSHLAHARPNFRGEDWQYYQVVNRKFADAVCQEVDGADPIVLVQDYHFALAPGYLRERLPRATVMMFWHIPWPNSERFGICPQRDELLEGMLGSSILGFHTQVDCNNFVDSVDRYLEARIDRERNAVVRHGRTTLVRPYPISLEWPSRWAESALPVDECRATLRRRLGLSEQARIGVGVDRLDYTKGIEERLLAVERLLERFPEYVGQLTFVQLAAPSREVIDRYRQLREDVERQADRINARFGSGDYRPIVLLRSHHEPPEVFTCYRAADFCYVSSLHDGMNLVAKEFVAARDDELGVLVLSQFTGAARELPEALIVNPYDLEEASSAMAAALVMSPQEQRERIRSMRRLLADLNVYRWAGKMVIDAARLRGRDRLMGRLTSRFEDIHQEARRAGKHLVRSR